MLPSARALLRIFAVLPRSSYHLQLNKNEEKEEEEGEEGEEEEEEEEEGNYYRRTDEDQLTFFSTRTPPWKRIKDESSDTNERRERYIKESMFFINNLAGIVIEDGKFN